MPSGRLSQRLTPARPLASPVHHARTSPSFPWSPHCPPPHRPPRARPSCPPFPKPPQPRSYLQKWRRGSGWRASSSSSCFVSFFLSPCCEVPRGGAGLGRGGSGGSGRGCGGSPPCLPGLPFLYMELCTGLFFSVTHPLPGGHTCDPPWPPRVQHLAPRGGGVRVGTGAAPSGVMSQPGMRPLRPTRFSGRATGAVDLMYRPVQPPPFCTVHALTLTRSG